MNKAKILKDLYHVLKPEALDFSTMKEFYCGDTFAVRFGDKYASPIEKIKEYIINEYALTKFLFLGHKGCGKSTELNRLKEELCESGYKVVIINSALEFDMQNLNFIDILVLITQKLLEIAEDVHFKIDKKLKNNIIEYWKEAEITIENTKEEYADVSTEAGIGVGVLIKLFAKAAAELKYGSKTKKTVRDKVEQRVSDWINMSKLLSDGIASKLSGRHPVFIFEDLDKLDPAPAWEMFHGKASTLSSLPFHVIYTFPISLSYRLEYGSLESYFTEVHLPMIKVRNMDMSENREGLDLIKRIVYLRVEEKLFNKGVLERMIFSTGGSLRDLFSVINNAARRAISRESICIQKEDMDVALRELRSNLTKRIEANDYDDLVKIYQCKDCIDNRQKLLNFMQSLVVLEYNGMRWHDVHPLVVEFLKEQGRLS